MVGYTVYQEATLALLPKVTGGLGFLGSCFVASEILRDHRNGKGNPIKRAIFAITMYEIPHAFAYFLSSWPSPSNFAFASGTIGTCNLQGFLIQLVFGVPLSTLTLIYFFFVVLSSQNDSDAAISRLRKWEWKVHASIASFTIFTAFFLLWKEQYNPTNQLCWVNGYPSGCGNSVFGGGAEKCERGEHAYLYGLVFFFVELWLAQVFQIYLHIAMRRTAVKQKIIDINWITRQSVLYSLAFLVTWTPTTMWSIFTWTGGGGFWLDLMTVLTEPLQGFWNFLIFIHNRPESIERLEYILLWEFCFPTEEKDSIESLPAQSSMRSTNMGRDDELRGHKNSKPCRMNDF